jgi:hypothetical protein
MIMMKMMIILMIMIMGHECERRMAWKRTNRKAEGKRKGY